VEKEKYFSGRFLIITSIIVIGISAYFYMNERKFIDNSMTIAAKISDIKYEPRKRVLQMKTMDERISDSSLLVTVPFWDTRKIGEQIRVRISIETASQVKVDGFICLHKASMGILAGFLILLGILSGVIFCRKRDNYS